MCFDLNLFNLPKLQRVETGKGRIYVTPEGNRYPSVTTILSEMSDKSFLDKWKASIGEEEANRQSRYAANRGTIVHKLCEDLIFGNDLNLKQHMPMNVALFKQFENYR